MNLYTYLYFDGQCEEAFQFYGELLGGHPELMTYDQAPDDAAAPSDSWEGRVLHARLDVGNTTVLGSDIPACDDHQLPQGMRVTLEISEPDEAVRIFDSLREEGRVDLELESTFWAKQFGMLTDRFGTPWMINCPK